MTESTLNFEVIKTYMTLCLSVNPFEKNFFYVCLFGYYLLTIKSGTNLCRVKVIPLFWK